jgi:hypothetical protein
VIVRDAWLLAIPGNYAASGICLYVMVDNVTLVDRKPRAVLAGRMIAMNQ